MGHHCLDCGHTWGTPASPQPPQAPQTPPQARLSHATPTDDPTPADWLRSNWDWHTELTNIGWTLNRHQGQDTYWTRPGKPTRDGHSAVLHGPDGPFVVWTTSAPELAAVGKPTADGSGYTATPFEFFTGMKHGGDFTAATRAIRHQMPATTRPTVGAVDRLRTPPPPNVDPETGEILEQPTEHPHNLPADWWDQRPELAHIRDAAHNRRVSADAVLGCVLARTTCLIPWSTQLPATVGTNGTLNHYTAIVDASGGGKSAAKNVAAELVPLNHRKDIRDNVSPGSGEGLIEAFLEHITEQGPDGKNTKVKRQTRNAIFVFADEGQALLNIGERSGSTLMPILRTAWSGGDLGTANATQETHRELRGHHYRIGIVVGFQLEYAATLIADAAGGTPQRFVFHSATDPHIPTHRPAWPGPLTINPPNHTTHSTQTIHVHPDIQNEIDRRRLDRSRGTTKPDPLDTHADYATLKTAGILATLNGHPHTINPDDWQLAEQIMDVSRTVRSWAIEHAHQIERRNHETRTRAAIEREAAIDADKTARALDTGARAIARTVHRTKGTTTRTQVNQSVSGQLRKLVTVDALVDEAVSRGWVDVADGGYVKGRNRP